MRKKIWLRKKTWLCRQADGDYAVCKYKPKKNTYDMLCRASYPFALVRNLCSRIAEKWFGLKKPLEKNTCVKVYFNIEVSGKKEGGE